MALLSSIGWLSKASISSIATARLPRNTRHPSDACSTWAFPSGWAQTRLGSPATTLGCVVMAGHRHDCRRAHALPENESVGPAHGSPTLHARLCVDVTRRRREGVDRSRAVRRFHRAECRLLPGARRRDRNIASVLTIVDGKVVDGAEEFSAAGAAMPPASPDWAPVRRYGGYVTESSGVAVGSTTHRCSAHTAMKAVRTTRHGLQALWGPLGCGCWAY